MLTAKRLLFATIAFCWLPGPAPAYIDRPPTLGRIIQDDAKNIVVMRVEKVSKDKQVILYEKVADLKGVYPAGQMKQHVARRVGDAPDPEENPRPRGAHSILDWAEPGKLAVWFHDADRKACVTCVGNAWYFGWAGEDGWWDVNEFEERGLAWAYVGPVDKLRDDVVAILAGKEVVVAAARYDRYGGGSRELWDNQTAYANLARDKKVRLWRIRASLTIVNYEDAMADESHFVVGPGAGGREAVPGLVERLKDKDPSVRRQAVEDLGQVGPEAAAAAPALAEALKDLDGGVRVGAAEALWEIGDKTKAAVPALAAALKDKQVGLRRSAAEVLWRMGPDAGAAVGSLAEALKDEDAEVRRDAADALWRIGAEARFAIPALIDALKGGDAEVRRRAAGALGTFGAEAGSAVPTLREALGDKDLPTRHFAARALVRLGDREARRAAAPVLREVLHEGAPDQRVRAEIIVFLWQIGPEPDSTFPTLKDGDAGDVMAAVQLLRKADPETRRNAVPTLVAALRGAKSDASLRASVVQALGRIGPAAEEALPSLVTASEDKDESVRGAAAEALKSVRRK